MLNIRLAAQIADAMVRTLYCSGPEEFKTIFGTDGPYLWSKFLEKNRAEGDFICYLDLNNKELLARHAFKNEIE